MTSGSSGYTSSFDIASAIVWATRAGARAINLSVAGGGDTRVERAALTYAITRGCVAVAASGNSGTTGNPAVLYPAAYAADGLCVSVGASDAWDRRAAFSSYGPSLDLVAPGLDVWSTAPTYPNAFGARWPGYLSGSGTSFAAPHVTGTIGLMVARRPDLDGVFVASDTMAFGVMQALIGAGRKIPRDISVIGFDNVELDSIEDPDAEPTALAAE